MTSLERLLATSLANPSIALAALDRADCEERLVDFVRIGWSALEPGTRFVPGKPVEAICEHLEAVSRGEIRRLLINVPPGCTKSMTTNVFWPSWEWGPRRMPHLRYISASYAAELSIRDNLRGRDLMTSEWYASNWGDVFALKSDQNAKIRYENDKAGWRYASSVGASITGHRGDRVIVDDPHSVQNVESEADRESSLRWFSETLPTRLNNLDESAIVVIMQRVHERDVSGLILAKEMGYDHLMLPMEFEPDHPHISRTSLGFRDWRTTPGELLWPERFSPRALGELKSAFRSWGGSYAEAGQLQQRPAPRSGGMFQRDDFQFVDRAPDDLQAVVRGWDLAASKDKRAAKTAGVKIGRDRAGRFYVLDARVGQWGPREVETSIVSAARADGPACKQDLPQDPGQAGKAQVAYLAGALAGHDFAFSPESGSKEDRARPFSAQCEAGNVYLVRGPWTDGFVNECCMFPNGEFMDQVDAASRAFARLLVVREPLVGFAPQLVGGDF